MTDTKKRTNYLFILFRISFVIVGVVLAIIWASQEQRWRKLTQIGPLAFIFSLIIFIIAQILIAFRWRLLLKSQMISIPFLSAVRLHFLGLFYNNCMPGSVGGDLIRAWYVTKHTDKKFEAALSVFVDRIVGLFSTFVIAVFFYLVFLQGKSLGISSREDSGLFDSIYRHRMLIIGLAGIIMLVIAGLMLYKKSRIKLKNAFFKISKRVLEAIIKLKTAIILYCKKPLILFSAFGLTIFIQLMTITGFWFIGLSLGIEANIKYYYVFFTLTWVLGAIPVSIGGAVVVEGMLIILFTTYAGVNKDAALALALSQRFIWLLSSLPGAVIHLVGAHLPKDFSIDYQEPIA
ncbi:MAG: flippase-like domain-containing protein [Sedimentisphaerales bacterium]|nr:flippase-like domain-containing protein [Sedimentisphaerales bacterium]